MGVALEPDFILELPEAPRDYETHTAKRKLIPPVTATVHEKRRQAQSLLRQHTGNSPMTMKEKPTSLTNDKTICKVHPLIQWFMNLNDMFARLIMG